MKLRIMLVTCIIGMAAAAGVLQSLCTPRREEKGKEETETGES